MDHQPDTTDDPQLITSELQAFPIMVEWGLDQFDAHEDSASRISIALGLGGLGLLLSVFASIPPIAIYILNSSVGLPPPPGYLLMAVIGQSIYLPPLISLTIVISTAFFWCAPIWIRYLAATLLAMPAAVVFLALISYLIEPVTVSLTKSLFAAMFALFVGAGATALIYQMWSPWALSHFRLPNRRLPKHGTRALFELTTVTAISYAIIVALSRDPALTTNDFVIGMMLLSGFAIVASMAGIRLIQVFLRDRWGPPTGLLLPLSLLLGTALILPTFMAVQQFGWNNLRRDAPIVLLAAAYGMLLICGIIALHLGWLRICGWRCLHCRIDD